MSLEIVPFFFTDQSKFQKARAIRQKVFIEEQKVEERDEFDEFEESSSHYLMSLNNKAIGTARWRQIGSVVKLERFAVLEEYRGKKYGDQLLQRVISDAKKRQLPLYLHAQIKAIPFYARRGFEKVGEMFSECDIDHYKMVLSQE